LGAKQQMTPLSFAKIPSNPETARGTSSMPRQRIP
jgi:hypothetical protein